MPGESGVTVVTMLVCFQLSCTRGCGCIVRPAFPAPSFWRVEENYWQTSGALRGEIADARLRALDAAQRSDALLIRGPRFAKGAFLGPGSAARRAGRCLRIARRTLHRVRDTSARNDVFGCLTIEYETADARSLCPLSRLRGRDGVGEGLAPAFVAVPTLTLPRKREREEHRLRGFTTPPAPPSCDRPDAPRSCSPADATTHRWRGWWKTVPASASPP
jgi:hypothetical protein